MIWKKTDFIIVVEVELILQNLLNKMFYFHSIGAWEDFKKEHLVEIKRYEIVLGWKELENKNMQINVISEGRESYCTIEKDIESVLCIRKIIEEEELDMAHFAIENLLRTINEEDNRNGYGKITQT